MSKCAIPSFFFSSRRRHTRLVSDWSSDVCSSDLKSFYAGNVDLLSHFHDFIKISLNVHGPLLRRNGAIMWRSEERRVGKEWRSRWRMSHLKKNMEGTSRVNAYEGAKMGRICRCVM